MQYIAVIHRLAPGRIWLSQVVDHHVIGPTGAALTAKAVGIAKASQFVPLAFGDAEVMGFAHGHSLALVDLSLQPVNAVERIDKRSEQVGFVKCLWINSVKEINNMRGGSVQEIISVAHLQGLAE